MIEVLEPGFLTTVQDAGRPDWTHLGVPVGGACDTWSLAVANLLAGNPPGAAALEMTIVGPTIRAVDDIVVAVAGADLGGGLRPGRAARLRAGEVVELPGTTSAAGARAYLAIAGGIDVPRVLGSSSTALASGFGGFDGRALRAGDVLRGGTGASRLSADAAWPRTGDEPEPGGSAPALRVVRGPAAAGGRLEALLAGAWTVTDGSDRVGMRLAGPPIVMPYGGSVLSHGVTFGSIQVPPDGAPIVLLADGQTTGGYPVPAVVISADRPRLGQLRPGDEIAFEEIPLAGARDALLRRKAAISRGAAIVRESAGWDELWLAAGG
jgi:antagonist of KipI